MKKYRFITLIAIIAVVILTTGCFILPGFIRDGLSNREKDIDSGAQDAADEETINKGVFTGIPLNQEISSIFISGQAIDVDVSGNYAYLTNDLGVLYIINIADRSRPFIVGKCPDVDSGNIVIVDENFAYVSYTEWIPDENQYYSECGFKIIDISDKEAPVVIGDYNSGRKTKKSVFGLFIDGNIAYLNTSTHESSTEYSTLEIVDISNKNTPEFLGELVLEGSPANITVDGDKAYININYYDYDKNDYMYKSQLLILDISDKKNPFIESSLEIPSNSWGIYQDGGKIYLSSNRSDDDTYHDSIVQIVDISRDMPFLRGSITIPGGAWELDMAGEFLYVSDLTGGAYSIDISDSDEPFIAGRLKTGGTSYDITIKGNYGYIADGFEGLAIMKLSDDSGESTFNGDGSGKENKAPVAKIDINGDTIQGYYISGTPVLISGLNAFDPEGMDLDYLWKINGEFLSNEDIIDNIFNKPGNYKLTLEVSDGSTSDGIDTEINIADANEPIINIEYHEFNIEIEYILNNMSQQAFEDIECLMRIPMTYEPYQIIESFDTNIPTYEVIYDNHWNKLLRFDIENKLDPGESLSVKAIFNVRISEYDYSGLNMGFDYDKDDPDLFNYTRDDFYIDSESKYISGLTADIVGRETEPLKVAGKIYNYIVRNLSYDYERAEDRQYEFMSASEILKKGSGVCADYAILYTAMLRAAGIPARLAAGIPVYTMLYEPDKSLDIGHAWVEIKLPGYGWVPVDITTEEDFWASNYFLDIVTERGPGYIYEHSTMDWGSYYYDGFDFYWDGENVLVYGQEYDQDFIYRADMLELSDILKD